MDLVAAVRAYAEANYEKDGWDFLVECWSDEDIAEAIEGARTVNGAVKRCRAAVKVLAEYRADICSAGW